MCAEVDHIIICTNEPDRAAARLVAVGLTEGTANTHPGQGTACRRFFFRNLYLELLFVTNEVDVRSASVKRTRLWERCRGVSGVCPFGVAFRPHGAGTSAAPFDSWEYRPKYLPEGLQIDMAANTEVLSEPLLLYLSFAVRPDSVSGVKQQPLTHAIGVKEITSVGIAGPIGEGTSDALAAVCNENLIGIRQASGYELELGFDGGSARRTVDLGPELPLVLQW